MSIRQTQNFKDESRKSRRLTDKSSQTDLKPPTRHFESIAGCPIHDEKVCTCLHEMGRRTQKASVTITRPSSRPSSRQTQADIDSHDFCDHSQQPHRCSIRIEPTTSCESHFQPKKVLNASCITASSRKYEADDEKSSADTMRHPRKTPFPPKMQAKEEESIETLPELQTPRKSTKADSKALEDSEEILQQARVSRRSTQAPKEEPTRRTTEKSSNRQTLAWSQKMIDEDSEELVATNVRPTQASRKSAVDYDENLSESDDHENYRPTQNSMKRSEVSVASRAKSVIEDENRQRSLSKNQPRDSRRSKSRGKSVIEDEQVEDRRRSSQPREGSVQRRTTHRATTKYDEDSLDISHETQPRRSTVKKSLRMSDDEMDPICSAASGNISVPHLCTRNKLPCSDSCTTHVIKTIDDNTRVCACAGKHPRLFNDIRKSK